MKSIKQNKFQRVSIILVYRREIIVDKNGYDGFLCFKGQLEFE